MEFEHAIWDYKVKLLSLSWSIYTLISSFNFSPFYGLQGLKMYLMLLIKKE